MDEDSWHTAADSSPSSSEHRSRGGELPASAADVVNELQKKISDFEQWVSNRMVRGDMSLRACFSKAQEIIEQVQQADKQLGTKWSDELIGIRHEVAATKQSPATFSPLLALKLSARMMPPEQGGGDKKASAESDEQKSRGEQSTSPTVPKAGSKGDSPPHAMSPVSILERLKKIIRQIPSTGGTERAVGTPPRTSADAQEKPDAVDDAIDDVTMADVNAPSGDQAECSNDNAPGAQGQFIHAEAVPDSHKYRPSMFQPKNARLFLKSVTKEIELLKNSLPPTIMVKAFEDRMDLFSVLIKGPQNTPYEGGLFVFDMQLPAGYPNEPPVMHYWSFCNDRLNPNLYENGKVCVSLLGTWTGRGSETWQAGSTLLQLFVSIQGLILVDEPYYNEAGYEKQRGTALADENSRLYNEMAVVKMVQSMAKMAANPPATFRDEIHAHIRNTSADYIARLQSWIDFSEYAMSEPPEAENASQAASRIQKPSFPLLPGSKGFCLSLRKALKNFQDVTASLNS